MKLYRGLTIDPAWWEQGGGVIKRGAQAKYPLIRDKDIPDVIMGSPLWRPDPAGAFVWLWIPSWRSAVGQAASVLRALGARPVRKWLWCKGKVKLPKEALARIRECFDDDNYAYPKLIEALEAMGVGKLVMRPNLGQYGRGVHEDLVLGVIGKLKPLPAVRSILDVLVDDGVMTGKGGRRHSAKPAAMYERVRAAGPGPHAALFERDPRPGFDTWGSMRGEGHPPCVALWSEARQQHAIVSAARSGGA